MTEMVIMALKTYHALFLTIILKKIIINMKRYLYFVKKVQNCLCKCKQNNRKQYGFSEGRQGV